jgi:putative hydrolases of HD superfamily
MNLKTLIPFVQLTLKFQQTKRSIYAVDENRLENDAEHSYQIGIVAWYLNNMHKLELNTELLIKYALVHDLVEVYAGDTPNFGEGAEEMKKTKHERETQAMLRLREEFSSFEEMNTLIDRYEKLEDKESRFVYILDKFLGPLNVYLDKGRSWHKNKVTLKKLIENKEGRIMKDPVIFEYFKELSAILREEEQTLFPHI